MHLKDSSFNVIKTETPIPEELPRRHYNHSSIQQGAFNDARKDSIYERAWSFKTRQ